MALSASATTTSFTSRPTVIVPSVAFTTPFAQPRSCSSLRTTTSGTFLLPDTSDPRYIACLAPAGNHFSFSPAVCPQGWPAWWLSHTTPAGVSGAATATATATAASSVDSAVAYVSTAYCCAPGYSMLHQGFQDAPSPSCTQEFITTTSSSGAAYAETITLSVAMLPAWHISWQTTDMPTLSPRPPALDEGERFTRWVPGSKPEREKQDNAWGGDLSPALYYFLVVGIPLLIVAGIAACLTGCCARRRAIIPRGSTGAAS
ncbi:hypothetical protein NKR19_g4975 [Coniochaeta hoffmannii]|uniref:Uncharacterized protein n=1 Tax=Coniochaeta hoffmannii TaxID=91930 RepID=A0AA38VU35_9PEZI|nr:hypothetical protein NKR19_g4975 [Coniochaeta hoffmannii]